MFWFVNVCTKVHSDSSCWHYAMFKCNSSFNCTQHPHLHAVSISQKWPTFGSDKVNSLFWCQKWGVVLRRAWGESYWYFILGYTAVSTNVSWHQKCCGWQFCLSATRQQFNCCRAKLIFITAELWPQHSRPNSVDYNHDGVIHHTRNKTLLILLRQLSQWRCPHLLLTAGACSTAPAAQPQLSINFSCPQGDQQQTRRPPLLF